jgi:anion-transporting  ArsA/GET3 family ATPase
MPVSRSLEAMAETVPGIRDIITMGKVLFELGTGEWDLVVADGPATGQIMSYLQAPRTIAGLIPSGRARRQADEMTETMASANASLAMITLAEELPVTETLEALEELKAEAPIRLRGVWANRLLEPLGVGAGTLEEVHELAVKNAGLLHRGIYENQRRWRKYLPEHHRLPFVFGEHDPATVARLLSQEIWQ